MTESQFDSQRVLDVAGELFEECGFEQTSLAAIAEKADIPLEMLEQGYGSSIDIALKIYHAMAESSLASVANLPGGTISGRYFAVMEDKLSQLSVHQETVSALFARAMRPSSSITAADISPGLRDPMMAVMQQVIGDASDKPAKDEDELALFLYTFHFLAIVFWLYDRTDKKEASQLFINFLREFIKMVRPMMVMPMVAKALNKISRIMMVVFGGARLVDSSATEE